MWFSFLFLLFWAQPSTPTHSIFPYLHLCLTHTPFDGLKSHRSGCIQFSFNLWPSHHPVSTGMPQGFIMGLLLLLFYLLQISNIFWKCDIQLYYHEDDTKTYLFRKSNSIYSTGLVIDSRTYCPKTSIFSSLYGQTKNFRYWLSMLIVICTFLLSCFFFFQILVIVITCLYPLLGVPECKKSACKYIVLIFNFIIYNIVFSVDWMHKK